MHSFVLNIAFVYHVLDTSQTISVSVNLVFQVKTNAYVNKFGELIPQLNLKHKKLHQKIDNVSMDYEGSSVYHDVGIHLVESRITPTPFSAPSKTRASIDKFRDFQVINVNDLITSYRSYNLSRKPFNDHQLLVLLYSA